MKTVQIFLSTYNGEKYIQEQLESLFKQKGVRISILVRDDGSSDRTVDILKKYQENGKIRLVCGHNEGYARSFLDLVKEDVSADYYAFCDQDDVWLPNKLINAVKMIESSDADGSKPVLYASALQRVDTHLNMLPIQDFKNLKLTLGAEFTRHRLAGCSFVFNNELRNLLKMSDGLKCSHDRLATLLCLACGGTVLFDHNSYILFRRHGDNASPDGMSARQKIMKDLRHYFHHENDAAGLAIGVLQKYKDKLTGESLKFLTSIAYYRANFIKTISLALNSQIDCGFWFFNLFVRSMILLRLF